jgi:hypothetical protein
MHPATINHRYKFGFFLTLVAVGLCLLFDASLKQTAGALILGFAAALLLGGLKIRTLQIIGCVIVSASGVAIVGARLMSWRDTTEQAAHEYDDGLLDLLGAIARPAFTEVSPITAPSPVTLDMSKSVPLNSSPTSAIGGRRASQPASMEDFNKYLVPKTRSNNPWAIVKSEPLPKTLKIVEIPESAKKWEKRFPINSSGKIPILPDYSGGDKQSDDVGPFMLVTSIPFPQDESDSEIMSFFQAEILHPRPVVSLKNALRAELRFVLLGLALFTAGVFGVIWLAWARPTKSQVAESA